MLLEVLNRLRSESTAGSDLYLQARRAERLTLAAELQWQLLAAHACAHVEYSLGAQLEPAYPIYGDNFDWSTFADHLVLTVTAVRPDQRQGGGGRRRLAEAVARA